MASCKVINPIPGQLRMKRGKLKTYVNEALGEIGNRMVTEIDRNLSGRVLHFRSGRLWSSWRDPRVTNGTASWKLTLGSDAPYARIHEFGGRTGAGHRTVIPQRPYLRRASLKLWPVIQRRLKQVLFQITRWT